MSLDPHKVKRITILFSEIAGYSIACWRELKAKYNVELQVFHWKPVQDAPFDLSELDWIDQRYLREGYDASQIAQLVAEFAPHGIYISGWMDRGYLQVAREMKQKGVPVISGLDGQWSGSLRQRLGCLLAPLHLHPAIDILWVTGERQAQFAERLGYTGDKCWYGLYCCDWEQFAREPGEPDGERENAFLYIGRYVTEKGIEDLVNAYALYRSQVKDPWNLICAGVGKMKHLLTAQEGIVDVGFIQPSDLPALIHEKATAFVLPSRKEPWGVVLQEAAAAGLPLICSNKCGASVHLVQDNYNGFLFASGNAVQLAKCMVRLHELPAKARVEMGTRSFELSRQFTPRRWADTVAHALYSARV